MQQAEKVPAEEIKLTSELTETFTCDAGIVKSFMLSCVGGSKCRQVLYQRYIRAMQVLYQLPIKTSGEDSCIATNKAIKNVCGGYYRVDDINYLCHVRYIQYVSA